MIARALGAVAKLQLRIRDVGAAADRALVAVALALLLALRLADGVVEVRRLLGPRLLPLGKAPDLRREEHKEVQQRHERQHRADPVAPDGTEEDDIREVARVQNGHPLDLDRNEEEQQHLRVGIERGEGEEHGKIHIGRARHLPVVPGDQTRDDRAERREEHAAEVVDGELRRTPLTLERRADPVIEIAAHQQPEGSRVRRQKAEGQQPPELPLLEPRPAEAENGVKGASVKRGEQGEQIEGDVADDDVEHQVRNAEVRMQHAEAVDAAAQRIQGRSLRS